MAYVIVVVIAVLLVVALIAISVGLSVYFIHKKRKQKLSKKNVVKKVKNIFLLEKHSKSMSLSVKTIDSGGIEPSLPNSSSSSSSGSITGIGEDKRKPFRKGKAFYDPKILGIGTPLSTTSVDEDKSQSVAATPYEDAPDELMDVSKSSESVEKETSDNNRKAKRKPKSADQSPVLCRSDDKRTKSQESNKSPPRKSKSNNELGKASKSTETVKIQASKSGTSNPSDESLQVKKCKNTIIKAI